MNQSERTRRSRQSLLEAALELFSRRGFRGTTVRDIADRAGRSTGTFYHLFDDKEAIFRALLDRYWEAIKSPEYPVNRALAAGSFPDDLEALGRAAKQAVEEYRPYIALIYVDVVELGGEHIRKFYSGMADRFRHYVEHHPESVRSERLRQGVAPEFAVMLASRIFLQYFAVEILFGVPDHFGSDSDRVVHEIADVLRRGLLTSTDGAPTEPS